MKTLVINVEDYVYVKQKKSDVQINLPLEPIFTQEYNHRVVTGIFPLFAEWDNNNLYRMRVIEINEADDVRIVEFGVSPEEISRILSYSEIKNLNSEDAFKLKICNYLIKWFTEDRISSIIFWSKYEEFHKKVISNKK